MRFSGRSAIGFVAVIGSLLMFGQACNDGSKQSKSSNKDKPELTGKDNKKKNKSGNGAFVSPEEDMEINKADLQPNDGDSNELFQARYKVTVFANLFGGTNLCQGEINLVVNKDMSMTFPQSNLSCAGSICEVDMKALETLLQKQAMGSAGKAVQGLDSDQKFLSVEKVGDFTFSPARPVMLLSPFYFEPLSEALKVNETYQGTVTDNATGTTSSGTINLRVTEANQDRLSWTMETWGWEGIARPLAALVPKFEITWNLNPIQVPYIRIYTVLGDIIKATKQPGAAQTSPQELARLCSGTTGQIAGSLAGYLPDENDTGIFASMGRGIQQLGERMVSDVVAGLSLELINQRILGQDQGRE